MRQLTKQERARWKASFEVRQTPPELLANWTLWKNGVEASSPVV
jgi:hypothetical protein